MSANKRLLVILASIVVCIALVWAIPHFTTPKISYTVPEDDYQAFFLSMFPIGNFSEEEFLQYRGLKLGKLSKGDRASLDYVLSSTEFFRVANSVIASNNSLDTVYLGIDPYLLPHTYAKDSGEVTFSDNTVKELKNLFSEGLYASPAENPLHFTFVYPFDRADTLASLSLSSHTALKEKLTCYRAFASMLFKMQEEGSDNWSLYFPGTEEWLIDNPFNYEGGANAATVVNTPAGISPLAFSGVPSILTKEMSHRLLLLCFCDGRYRITSEEELAEKCDQLETFVTAKANGEFPSPDLSNQYFLFLGDSILANDPGSCSVTSVFSAFSGAEVANASQGGTPVVANPDFYLNLGVMIDWLEMLGEGEGAEGTDDEVMNGVSDGTIEGADKEVSDGFFDGVSGGNRGVDYDMMRYSCPVFAEGLKAFATYRHGGQGKELSIVLSLGINDCLNGAPLDLFANTLSENISRLTKLYPDAHIYLTAPSYIDNRPGSTLKLMNPDGDLEQYLAVVTQVASEHSLPVIDVYHMSEIGEDNCADYLNDGIHPNEAGRRMIALAYLDYFLNECAGF